MAAIPLSEVGRRGRLILRFASRGGETVLSKAYCEVPCKITRLQNSGGFAHLTLMHTTAGLFGGDVIDTDIHVEAGTRVLITQQSATKVHPACGQLAVQSNRIRVDNGGVLHLYYEPLIPFTAARVMQNTSFEVENGARLYFWESIMAGRVARGEVWQFDELQSETMLRVEGRLTYLDRFQLTPRAHSPAGVWRMGAAHYLATGLCHDAHAAEMADSIHEQMPDAGVDTPAPNLLAIRVAAANGLEFHRNRMAFTLRIGAL